MAIVTTTHYVPDSSGWSHRGFYFRLKVVQDYDNVANASNLTVSLESYHASYSGTFNFLDNSSDPAYIKADGNTLVTLGTSYKFKYAASTTWQQLASSNATTWTYTVSHDSSGNATVNFETAGRIYLYTGGSEYYGDMDKTMSYTFTGVRAFSLSISAGTGSIITVKRGGEALSNGATIYYGDVLNISFSALTGYEVESAVLNGNEITSPYTHQVAGSVDLIIVTALLSSAWICINGVFRRYFINIYTQGTWRRCREKIFPGGGTGQQAICGQALCGTIKCGGA